MRVTTSKYAEQIAPKSIARTRKDIASWNQAISMTRRKEHPKWWMLQQLFNEILMDAHLTSQYNNRILRALSKKITIRKANGEIDQKQTDFINNSTFLNKINKHILDAEYRKCSLIEFSVNENEQLDVILINRDNVDSKNGRLYPDYAEDDHIRYREVREYGTWLLEFTGEDELGLLNKAVPHVLFKRFAQSCWSELCEIYGIPPRVLKTDTNNPKALSQGERMMRDMGAAAWFIIDSNEQFEFAQGVSTDGAVYQNLIKLCNDEISLLISGAVVGQDTKNGSNSKEVASQELLKTLHMNDLRILTQKWNNIVIPALINIGILKGDVVYGYDKTEDLNNLWRMTKEILPYKNVSDEWVKEKFGIEVIGDRNQTNNLKQSFGQDFFY